MAILNANGKRADGVDPCPHDSAPVEFDEKASAGLSSNEVRKRWPRFWGRCPDCGEQLIKYASFAHYIAGDW